MHKALKELIEKSVRYRSVDNDGQDKHKGVVGQDEYYTAMRFGETIYYVRLRLDVYSDPNDGLTDRYKDYKIKKIDIEAYAGDLENKGLPHNTSISYVTLPQLTENVKSEVSKIVDENGEPLVVYHGTEAVFDVFDRTKGRSNPENFKQYFVTNLKNRILNLLKNIEKQVVGHKNAKDRETADAISKFSYSLCSLNEQYEDGELKYDIQDNTENDYFISYYPNIAKLLNQRELQIVVDYYERGIPLKEIAKKNNISYGRIRNMLTDIKNKLKVLNK